MSDGRPLFLFLSMRHWGISMQQLANSWEMFRTLRGHLRLSYLGTAFQNLSIVLMVTCLSGGGDFSEQEVETLAGRERGGRGEGRRWGRGGRGEGEGKRRKEEIHKLE